MRTEYKQKRDILVEAFTSVGLEDCTPDATIYLWQKTPENMNSVDFAKKLLEKEICVAVTPGAWISNEFNGLNPGDKYVRLALVPSLEETKEAARRIKGYLK